MVDGSWAEFWSSFWPVAIVAVVGLAIARVHAKNNKEQK